MEKRLLGRRQEKVDVFLLAVLALLAALAVCDLFVGVSNDAVNFLNAAVGSKAAPFWIIMAVASAGVLLGATFSSGMMEIAKTGVIVPEQLTFEQVMFVYCAVIVTDVLLLNTFNSLGLPTSTTVSIIFELLGGAVAMACWKVWNTGAPFTDLGLYVNSGKALAMIMGILVSVVVAFFAGLIVQYLLRTLFTFRYWKTYRYFGHSLLPRHEGRARRFFHGTGLDRVDRDQHAGDPPRGLCGLLPSL